MLIGEGIGIENNPNSTTTDDVNDDTVPAGQWLWIQPTFGGLWNRIFIKNVIGVIEGWDPWMQTLEGWST
jgi:hypothetical protein